jgi:hypothetical protein
MTGPGYNLLVPWSVRFTFSGDYCHDAYWSVGVEADAQGSKLVNPASLPPDKSKAPLQTPAAGNATA